MKNDEATLPLDLANFCKPIANIFEKPQTLPLNGNNICLQRNSCIPSRRIDINNERGTGEPVEC